MGTDPVLQSDHTRARRWFWRLLVISILLMGGVYRTVYAEPGLLTGAAFLVLSSLLVAALVQAVRVWVALQNAARGRTASPGADPARGIEPELRA